MVTWLAWMAIALATLVATVSLWITWQRLSDTYRRPAEAGTPEEVPSEGQPEVGHDDPPPAVLGELDERGYLSSRKLQMGCEAALCRTPFGARIVSGKWGLQEPQYAWDFASVRLAEKALVYAEFNTHPREGIIGVDEPGRGSYPAAEPQDYFRRWRYTADRQMQRF
jgi:hypothetical protein